MATVMAADDVIHPKVASTHELLVSITVHPKTQESIKRLTEVESSSRLRLPSKCPATP